MPVPSVPAPSLSHPAPKKDETLQIYYVCEMIASAKGVFGKVITNTREGMTEMDLDWDAICKYKEEVKACIGEDRYATAKLLANTRLDMTRIIFAGLNPDEFLRGETFT
jgi:hypothetical protein